MIYVVQFCRMSFTRRDISSISSDFQTDQAIRNLLNPKAVFQAN